MYLPLECQAAALTPTIDTSIYASGDVLFAATKIQNAVLNGKGFAYLRSVLITDLSNQKAAIDLLFFNEDPGSLGALNAALNISTAQLTKLVATLSIVSGDYTTLKAATNAAGLKLAQDLPLCAKATSKDIWVAGVARATPTYAGASDLAFTFLLERH